MFLLAGCAATQQTVVEQPRAKVESGASEDLRSAAKRDLHACIRVFYKDEWDAVSEYAARFEDLKRRWSDAGLEKSEEFAAAVDALTEAARSKSPKRTTAALESIAKVLGE